MGDITLHESKKKIHKVVSFFFSHIWRIRNIGTRCTRELNAFISIHLVRLMKIAWVFNVSLFAKCEKSHPLGEKKEELLSLSCCTKVIFKTRSPMFFFFLLMRLISRM